MTIKEIRAASGMTQKAFADYVGVNKSSVEKWERGRCPEHLRVLIEFKATHDGTIDIKKTGQSI